MNQTGSPRVTVLMPVYNGEKYLVEAVDSILGQTYKDFEFLIINDGSTDKTVEIVQSYNDPRIRLVNNDENLQLAAALHRGLQLTGSEYIARMDCDDISFPERLSAQVDYLDNHPDVGALGSGFQIIDGDGKKIGAPVRFPSEHGFLRWSLPFYSPIAHPTVLMRRPLLIEAGGYLSEVISGREKYSGEDYDLWRRLSKITRLANLRRPMIYLRKHGKNVTRIYLDEHLKNTEKISCLILSDALNEDVPIELARLLHKQKHESARDAVRAGNLIHRLYRSCIGGNELSDHEKHLVRKDAAMRLFNTGRPFVKNFDVWKIMLWAIFLNPCLAAESVKGMALSLFNKTAVPRIDGA